DDALKANLATRVQNWFYPLHTGSYGGLATRWLQLLAGLAMALLSLSGAWLFYRGWRARAAARPAVIRAVS
ncbi:MAG TPA: PepSY domain-containing protein, partial [Noviherbaspirillum sp.]